VSEKASEACRLALFIQLWQTCIIFVIKIIKTMLMLETVSVKAHLVKYRCRGVPVGD
jgi:hypothetical protein